MQFFINLDDKCAQLDGMGFIPFGKVVKGMDVVDIIAKQPRMQRPPDQECHHQERDHHRGK